MINQNLKILDIASFFLAELTVSTLLIILQSLLASYQFLLYNKSTFTIYCYGLPSKYAHISHIYPARAARAG